MRSTMRLGTIALLALVWVAFEGAGPRAARGDELQTYAAGKPARVGDLVYQVKRAFWANFPEVPGKPDYFLGVELSLKNVGPTTIQFPPFVVVGSDSKEHEMNTSKAVWPRMSLGPGQEESGEVFYHVPRDLTYRLMVSGGFLTSDFAFLDLGKVAPPK